MSTQTIVTRPRTRSRLVRPGRPRIQTTYQLQAELGDKIHDRDAAYKAAVQEMVSWLREKAPCELPAAAAEGQSFLAEDHGQRVECISMSDAGLWTCRFTHPDAGMGEIAAVPGRHWLIDLCFRKLETKTLFGVQVSCSMLRDDDAGVAFIRPAVVKTLINKTGLKQVRAITGEPWMVSTPEDLAAMEVLLLSPDRTLPVYVASTPDRNRWTYTPNPPVALIDAQWVAKQSVGYAHVVHLSYQMGFEWTKRVGPQWSAFDGAVRAYMPGLNFDEDSVQEHPLYRKDFIWWFKSKDHSGPKAFGEQLFSVARGRNVHGRWTAPELVTVSQARLVETEIATARMRELAAASDAAVKATMAKLSEVERERVVASETATRVREMLELRDRSIKALTERVDALDAALKAANAETEEWSDVAAQAARDRDHYDHQNAVLRGQINALRQNLEAKTGVAIDSTLAFPTTYEEMPEWVERNLAGRVELHPRALRSLKDARYEDVGLVYRGLLWLANEYRSMRMGAVEQVVCDEAMNRLGLKLSGSIDEARAGQEGDTYYIRYPVGTAGKEFLKFHLQKGSSKDTKLCLRIYFFWDEETQQVVVGWLPSHLENRMT